MVLSSKTELDLIHVHVCVSCGSARRREELDSREIGSGILHCPKCNSEGPLNVEVRQLQECDFG